MANNKSVANNDTTLLLPVELTYHIVDQIRSKKQFNVFKSLNTMYHDIVTKNLLYRRFCVEKKGYFVSGGPIKTFGKHRVAILEINGLVVYRSTHGQRMMRFIKFSDMIHVQSEPDMSSVYPFSWSIKFLQERTRKEITRFYYVETEEQKQDWLYRIQLGWDLSIEHNKST
mmetsp:Transcript_22932/g.25508  ORF Transcript_22932/g.25508 Transcript_22932/m.25508 type:complete len:171 (-) Transcript_22932:48-560(-)